LSDYPKSGDTPTAILPLGRDFKTKFNELDNWLGIMDLDPPRTELEKKAMYVRLVDILDDLFESGSPKSKQVRSKRSNKRLRVRLNKRQIWQQMQTIIER
jgi:hypothetical protein